MGIGRYSFAWNEWSFGALKTRLRRHLRQEELKDLTEVGFDPVHAHYLHSNGDFLMKVPVEKLRTMGFLGAHCTRSSGHPFVETLLDHDSGRCRTYAGSALQRYYETTRPKTAAALMGLSPVGLSEPLAALGPLEAVAPWWPDLGGISPSHIAQHQIRRTREENRENGADLAASEGMSLWGPVSDRKGQLEYARLVKIFESIRREGYKRSDAHHGDICGTLFQSDEDNYIVNVSAGQHRAAALAALGYEEIPVRFSRTFHARTVRREDAANWPFVRNGLFTANQARQVFDRIMVGRTIQSEGATSQVLMFRRSYASVALAS